MKSLSCSLSLTFAAGSFGALVNSVAAWLFGKYGVTAALGVNLAPALTTAWLYPRIVWGGIWGLLFVLPFWERSIVLKGIVISIAPTLFQLLVVFPYHMEKGIFGLQLGQYTPGVVIILNAVWGISAALWLRWCADRNRGGQFGA